ncbi:hypothetical protein JTE90_019018 [Oedothorax gibbosus]|uniref:Biogenesis of lysosome-related organelles complex 1 subunit 6 n=1 Tax=Oedothorax gibbosus TaxID=931172 RepID=A0AAV6UZ14_9ARAC|nr:hypothetical protein JTE90_019018 [Oedothorax gibbosus]
MKDDPHSSFLYSIGGRKFLELTESKLSSHPVWKCTKKIGPPTWSYQNITIQITMCDVITDPCPVISATDTYSEKEMLAQCSNDEEHNKDSAPEVLEKPDASEKKSGELLKKLSSGFLSYYVDDMKKSSLTLNELTRNQGIVIETLEQENARVTDALKMHPLDEMYSKIKIYHQKVLLLKKDMLAVYERTSRLKKRAMKLQQQKQKEALQKELQKDRELERDKQLAPKIATKSS